MYKEFFSLSEIPFSIAPDARYLYMSHRYQEALAHLYYGVEGTGGIVLLTGEVGTGKTTICRFFLDHLPDKCEVAYIYNPMLSVTELLTTICEEYGIDLLNNDRSNKALINSINQYLLEKHALGYKLLLIIDEAQNLSTEVLEQLRLLTNLETHERKLLQIILIGQPELRRLIEDKALTQLAQRIIARYHISPLSLEETILYVHHRLIIAGSGKKLFEKKVIRYIYKISHGIPRLINLLCDRALLGAFTQNKNFVDKKIVGKAAREALGYGIATKEYQQPITKVWLAGGLSFIATAMCIFIYLNPQYLQGLFNKAPWPILLSSNTQSHGEGAFWPLLSQASSETKATIALFKEWNINYDPTSTHKNAFCDEARNNGLTCLTGYGDIDTLRQLNMPAVIELKKDNESIYATLIHLDSAAATIVFDNRARQVSIPTLQKYWNGNYKTFLKDPDMSKESISLGSVQDTLRGFDEKLSSNKLATRNSSLSVNTDTIIPNLTEGHRHK